MQRRRPQAQLGEGVAQAPLGGGELGQLIGQRLGQPAHLLVALALVAQQLQARLQVQVHRARPSAHLLCQRLPGGLGGGGADAGSAPPPPRGSCDGRGASGTLYLETLHWRTLCSCSLADIRLLT